MDQRPAFLPALVLLLVFSFDASAQSRRPIPYPVMPTPQFEQAIDKGTRTTTGHPGPNYWTNTADYTIQVSLSPETKRLRGTETIRYHNNSPDELRFVLIHLRQNLHKENAMRNRFVPITGGMEVSEVKAGGRTLPEGTSGNTAGYRSRGTLMQVVLPEPIPSGGVADLELAWSFEVPERGAPRMGQDGEVFYLAYWYPQVAVYDDVTGWEADQYMGNGEFYMGYGNYDVAITVPEGWVIGATGALQNPEAVLSETTRSRLAQAAQTRETVSIVGEDERAAGVSTATSDTGTLTWRFQADDVRDFAFGASNHYVWDATTATVGDRDGDGQDDTAMIHAFYRPGTASWNRSAEFAQFSIEHLSKTIMPYPYPHMTTVEGLIGGGMEYPMITLIGGARNDRSLFGVTYHEISHMWFPMIVGQDEKQYTWMDEGLTSFNTNEGASEFWEEDSWNPARQGYYRLAGSSLEVESMRHADDYPDGTPARGIAGYSKPAVALHALRGMIGKDRFRPIYQDYARRWAFKHPQPYDLFNTFEDHLGEDLDWFWRTMFYETWTLDQAVASVEQSGEQVRITIADQGLSPMPAPVRVTYEDGHTAEQVVPVETWLNGEREAILTFNPGAVTRVEIDPGRFFPDVDRENNVWRNSNEDN